LPVDVLKIDRSFVHDIVTNRSHRLIVQTTINLASSRGLKTVAEGVETREQAELLAELGCRSIQGYLIRKPAGAAETAKWLAGADPGAAVRHAAERAAPDPLSATGRLRARGRDN
jgi:EAL domain-containing protein (putative c-di-GMP-specific phosphodiesterase class I)